MKLVLIANIIPWALVWYAMDQSLQNFAYRIDIDLLRFTLHFLAALCIALLTISIQALTAALANLGLV